MSEKNRIAIIDKDRCRPKKCNFECKRSCPINRTGKYCIEVSKKSVIAEISESLCIGCGICVKKCPFNAIKIINLPSMISSDIVHQYSCNSFRLYRLPFPQRGKVLGLIGQNGAGKSTVLKLLSKKVKPNFGNYDNKDDFEVRVRFKGTELQNFFSNNLTTFVKPQHVDVIKNTVKGTVNEILHKNCSESDDLFSVINILELSHLLDRQISNLSGGELQRFAIAVTCLRQGDVYLFDEPSSYLDIKQRITVGNLIRSLSRNDKYVIVVEHDLSLLDYLSDYVSILYGQPSAYGISSQPYNTGEGINAYLSGYISSENVRIRDDSLDFNISDSVLDQYALIKKELVSEYPNIHYSIGDYDLYINSGEFDTSEITVLLGQNGMGKTTMIRILAGLIPVKESLPTFTVSYKPQLINPKFEGTVRQLLHTKIPDTYHHPQFQSDVVKPLLIDDIIDHEVSTLSGGELQRVAIILALGKPADIYLLDEPSAYLDSEQRIIVSKIIKRFIMNRKKTAFVVEHDFIMATYLADKVIVYSGQPGVSCKASSPLPLKDGMNLFLKDLNVTFRRDPTNYRPRINKLDSVNDQEQKQKGEYF